MRRLCVLVEGKGREVFAWVRFEKLSSFCFSCVILFVSRKGGGGGEGRVWKSKSIRKGRGAFPRQRESVGVVLEPGGGAACSVAADGSQVSHDGHNQPAADAPRSFLHTFGADGMASRCRCERIRGPDEYIRGRVDYHRCFFRVYPPKKERRDGDGAGRTYPAMQSLRSWCGRSVMLLFWSALVCSHLSFRIDRVLVPRVSVLPPASLPPPPHTQPCRLDCSASPLTHLTQVSVSVCLRLSVVLSVFLLSRSPLPAIFFSCLRLRPSLCLSLSVSFSVSLCVFLCLSLSVCLSLNVPLSLPLCVSFSLHLPLCLPLYLSLSLCLSLSATLRPVGAAQAWRSRSNTASVSGPCLRTAAR